MTQILTVKARSLGAALQEAAAQLQTKPQDLSYRIVEYPKFFSLRKEYVVQVWKAPLLDVVLGHSKHIPVSSPDDTAAPVESMALPSSELEELPLSSEDEIGTRVIVKKSGIFIRLGMDTHNLEQSVSRALRNRGVFEELQDLIPKILEMPLGMYHHIAPFTGNVSEMAPIVLDVSEDRLQGFVTMKYPMKRGGPTPTFEEVLDFLRHQGIKDHFVFENIRILVEEEVTNTPVLVAQGVRGLSGKHSQYVKYYEPEVSLPRPEGRGALRINLKGHTAKYRSFKKGEMICKTDLSQVSKPGINIFGELIPEGEAEQELVKLVAGKNVQEKDNNFFAQEDGFVLEENGILSMTPLLTISSSVGYSTGNIWVLGDVQILGDIQAGFHVRATGSILVVGFIQRAKVNTDGDLEVRKGIIGSDIHVKGNLFGYYVANSHVYVLGNFFCAQQISNTKTECSGYVYLYGNKAFLIGGEMVVKKGLIAKRVGTPLQGLNLFVGFDPLILGIRQKLLNEKENLRNNIRRLELNLLRLERTASKKSLQEGVSSPLVADIQNHHLLLEKVEMELLKVEQYFGAQKPFGFVTVQGVLYPGVVLAMHGLEMMIKEKITKKTIRVQDGRWQLDNINTGNLEKNLLKMYKALDKK